MTSNETLQDIYGLDQRLRELEQKYEMLSADMYTLYRLGEFEQSRDLIRWVGYYELRQDRQHQYDSEFWGFSQSRHQEGSVNPLDSLS